MQLDNKYWQVQNDCFRKLYYNFHMCFDFQLLSLSSHCPCSRNELVVVSIPISNKWQGNHPVVHHLKHILTFCVCKLIHYFLGHTDANHVKIQIQIHIYDIVTFRVCKMPNIVFNDLKKNQFITYWIFQ